jgi:Ca-activated chloride channel family protein
VNADPQLSFLWPDLLWLLLLVLPLAVFYLRQQRRRRRLAAASGGFGLAQQANGKGPGARRHLPAVFFLLGLLILLVALARPQMVVSLPRIEETAILAFDVSGSMSAGDMGDTTRMEAAKAIARDFVTHQPITVQIGVVAFSESGFSVQLPTNDQQAILASINRITPQRGTSLASGILVSLETIAKQLGQAPQDSADFAPELLATPTPVPAGTYSSAVIILLSDGENNVNPDPLTAAQAAADRGVRIHTIGLGSATGTTLEVNGFTVHTQLDESILQQIAQLTGGTYHNAINADDRQQIYAGINPQLVIKPEKTEVTSLLAGIGLLLLLIGGAFSLLWFGRMP